MSDRFILLTGCSCGGKSTLLEALDGLGFATVPEPGRRIVAEETARAGKALPWVDPRAFALRAVEMAKADLEAAQALDGPVFFDRGLIDAAVALDHAGGPQVKEVLGDGFPYAQPVVVLPPWKELFAQDAERRHGFEDAVQEFHRIERALDDLKCSRIELPRAPVAERAAAVLAAFGLR